LSRNLAENRFPLRRIALLAVDAPRLTQALNLVSAVTMRPENRRGRGPLLRFQTAYSECGFKSIRQM